MQLVAGGKDDGREEEVEEELVVEADAVLNDGARRDPYHQADHHACDLLITWAE